MPYPRISEKNHPDFRSKWYDIIFNADTKEGRRFDILLLWAILLSVIVVMAESVNELQLAYHSYFKGAELFFTLIFTAEYIFRIYVSPDPRKYITSFWGIIDLVSTLPTYLGLLIHGPQFLFMIRTVRLLRVFRVLRLTSFMSEAQSLGSAIKSSAAKITVFFASVLIIVIVMGTVMHVIEPPEAGFTSIPRSIYWAIVTLTTVGYGDITPITTLGQFLSAMLMILGYAVIAVPTGIVSVEMSQQHRKVKCSNCGEINHESDALFCKKCGEALK
ncbi:ion transporter [bacterium]|nr:ion transporter [bacterium]